MIDRRNRLLRFEFQCSHVIEIRDNCTAFYDVFTCVQLWNEKLQQSHKGYADVMVHSDLSRVSLDIIGESAFGYKFNSTLEGETEITKAFTQITNGVDVSTAFLLAIPFYRYLPLEGNRLQRNAARITNEVVMKVC